MIRGKVIRSLGARRNGLAAALLCSTAIAMFASPTYAQDAVAKVAAPEDAASDVSAAEEAAQRAAVATDAGGAETSDIVITGIRGSLASAIKEKRLSDNLVEVIKAEDIGKLPDQNLAEVLENVTGVQITRAAGVGTMVQIRGTDANRTEINGVSTVGSGAGRSGISFDDLAASMISSVEVTKVPDAETIEGSVGGTINLRTIRPLSLGGLLMVGRVQGEYSDLSGTVQPRVSGTVGNKWDTNIGEFGIVVSGSYARLDVSSFTPRVDRDALVMPGTSPSALANPFLRIQFFQQGQLNYQYETFNGTTALEWKPSETLRFYFDATGNNQQRQQDSYRVQLSGVSANGVVDSTKNNTFETVNFGWLNGVNGPIDLGTVQGTTSGTMGIGGVTGKGAISPVMRTSSDTGSRQTNSRVFNFGFEWQGNDRFVMRPEISLSTSNSDFPNFSTTLDFINPKGPQPTIGNSLANGVPLEFDLRNQTLQFGMDNNSVFAPTSAQLLDPANYRLNQVVQGASSNENKEKAGRIDLSYDTRGQMPFITSVNAGYRWNNTTTTNNISTASTSLTNTTTAWNRPAGNLFSEILTPGPNNFNAADGRKLYFPDFLLINGEDAYKDPSAVLAALNAAIVQSNANKTQGINVPLIGAPTESAAGFFDISEITNALYAQVNFETSVSNTPVRGNLGVRWISTNLTSVGNNVQNGIALGQTSTHSNYSFWLPRFNLVVEPDAKVQVRGGIARDIRRPNFDALSTSYTFSTGANTPVTAGNPNLIPETVWSFDLSTEYYFARSSIISVGLFYKTRDNLFANKTVYPENNLVNGQLNISIDPTCPGGGVYNPIAVRNINNPIQGTGICVPLSSTFNVPGATTQYGIEVAFQGDLSPFEDKLGFASGFGFIGNFTLQQTGGTDLPPSEWSKTFAIWIEKETWNAIQEAQAGGDHRQAA